MARRTNVATNLLGRQVALISPPDAARLEWADTADLPIGKITLAGNSVEVVAVHRENGETWLDVSTPKGIVAIRASEVRIVPEVTA